MLSTVSRHSTSRPFTAASSEEMEGTPQAEHLPRVGASQAPILPRKIVVPTAAGQGVWALKPFPGSQEAGEVGEGWQRTPLQTWLS